LTEGISAFNCSFVKASIRFILMALLILSDVHASMQRTTRSNAVLMARIGYYNIYFLKMQEFFEK